MKFLTQQDKIDIMIDSDIEHITKDIYQNDMFNQDNSFLYSVLSGEGWIPYNQLTIEQIDMEFADRFCDSEEYEFDTDTEGRRIHAYLKDCE